MRRTSRDPRAWSSVEGFRSRRTSASGSRRRTPRGSPTTPPSSSGSRSRASRSSRSRGRLPGDPRTGHRGAHHRGARALPPRRVLRRRLTVWARCVDIRGARFRYEYVIVRGDELVADGWTRMRWSIARPTARRACPNGSRRRSLRADGRLGRRRRSHPSPALARRLRAAGFGFGFVPTRITRFSPLYAVFHVSVAERFPSSP